jgi:hypothetical protein
VPWCLRSGNLSVLELRVSRTKRPLPAPAVLRRRRTTSARPSGITRWADGTRRWMCNTLVLCCAALCCAVLRCAVLRNATVCIAVIFWPLIV